MRGGWRSREGCRLAIASGVAGLLAFLMLWDGRSQLAFNQGAIGAIVSVMLLITAIFYPHAFD